MDLVVSWIVGRHKEGHALTESTGHRAYRFPWVLEAGGWRCWGSSGTPEVTRYEVYGGWWMVTLFASGVRCRCLLPTNPPRSPASPDHDPRLPDPRHWPTEETRAVRWEKGFLSLEDGGSTRRERRGWEVHTRTSASGALVHRHHPPSAFCKNFLQPTRSVFQLSPQPNTVNTARRYHGRASR